MDYLGLPPEITSALIHSGPGASSLMEASAGWQQLSAELDNAVTPYSSVLSSMVESWNGPSSSAMLQAVQPYIAWLRTTAQQCQQLASSTEAAAVAFSSAQSSIVVPAQVTANRTQLAELLATDLFGRNLPAIAETENQYEAMWANNSAAMNRYQTAAAQAVQLPQFSSPPSIASPAAAVTQAAAVPAEDTLPSVPLLQSYLQFFDPQAGWFGLANQYANQFISSGFPINLLSLGAQVQSAQALTSVGGEVGQGLSEGEGALGAAASDLSSAITAAGSGAAPTGAMGVGVTVGKLTAPPAVVGLLPASQAPVQLASAASPLPAGDGGLPFLPPLMPPPISAGSGWRKRKQQKYEDLEIGAELKGTVIPRPPSAG